MPGKLIAALRRSGLRQRVLLGAALSLTLLPLTVGATLLDGGEALSPPIDEPILEAADPSVVRSPGPAVKRRGAPVVIDALPPAAPSGEATPEDEPPPHIRRENARLRRELAHLRAIQAENRRVMRQLQTAGIDPSLLLGSGELMWPVNGSLSSPFGMRWGRLHAGIDIAAPGGTPIRAADSGQVVLSGWQGGYGLYTCVQHTASLSTCYAHQSRLAARAGAAVQRGEVIGFVGNTGYSFGDHLHFETRVDGRPVDPLGFL